MLAHRDVIQLRQHIISNILKGFNQIDTIMRSNHISQHIEQATIQPYVVICESYHQTMYIDIILKECIHTCIANNKTPPGWTLCSNYHSNVKAYKENLIEELEYPRVKHLVETETKKKQQW